MKNRYLRYGSHLGCLQKLMELKPYRRVLEYGCGDFSTQFFIKNCEHLISIEMKNEDWFNKVRKSFNPHSGIILFKPDQEAIDWVELGGEKVSNIDLIFVDGTIRQQCINSSFTKAPTIAVHDVGMTSLRTRWFSKIDKTEGYNLFICRIGFPSTSVFTCDPDLKLSLEKSTDFVAVEW